MHQNVWRQALLGHLKGLNGMSLNVVDATALLLGDGNPSQKHILVSGPHPIEAYGICVLLPSG